jgi:GNAT superfamily N-acetyltransferase
MTWSRSIDIDEGELVARPLTPERFGDIEAVFGEKGVARRCFCMHWRRPDGGYPDKRPSRDRFADRVSEGRPPGLIGYLDGVPVGWVQVGPRDEFPTIGRSRLLKPIDDAETWSVNCFVTRVGYRRRGIAGALLTAAKAFAKSEGAFLVEGYPVDGERASVVDYFTGTFGMFQEEGFVEILRRDPTRPIVRIGLSPLSEGGPPER